MESLITRYKNLLRSVKLDFKRNLYHQINWDARAICILGARGTGKSTLMLQYLKEKLPESQSLYISLDDLYFKQEGLVEVAERFIQLGGKHLFLDEVHKYGDWQAAVKNLYDFYPDLKMVISGSSILPLQKSQVDLSRRLVYYELPELSFREYIALKHQIVASPVDLNYLLINHQELSSKIIEVLPHPLAEFEQYLQYGAYPFFKEGQQDYISKINQLINVIIDYDLPEGRDISTATQAKLKKLLYILSTAVPFSPNITKLAEKTETTRPRLLEMLHMLETSRLIRNLRNSSHGVSMMNKPDKIFLSNTNLIYALALENQNKGNVRETFFYNQLANSKRTVTYPQQGDFLIDDKYLFEIGGKNKDFSQIANLPDSFIAADDLEYGLGNKIPLYLFGFLY
ncbi:ATP-binding protein [Cognataquiflexum rubidum]|uniref:ATP-binding protein n=1 Tax=Cognataquiflexum rubidum TaxID=2922273 RepID=UPI0021D45373|nr:AAA family ATPase [Cognataquiflexum rubidum]